MFPQTCMFARRKRENGRVKLKIQREISKSRNWGPRGRRNKPRSTARSWNTRLHYGMVGRYLALVLPLCLLIFTGASSKRSDQVKTQQRNLKENNLCSKRVDNLHKQLEGLPLFFSIIESLLRAHLYNRSPKGLFLTASSFFPRESLPFLPASLLFFRSVRFSDDLPCVCYSLLQVHFFSNTDFFLELIMISRFNYL